MAKKTSNHSIESADIDVQPNERWTEEHARLVLHACHSRGESLLAFARRHGLSPQRLYWWSRRLQVPPLVHEPERALVPVIVTSSAVRLVNDLAISRAEGTYSTMLARLAKVDVLVLDDLLIAPLKEAERRDLLEILEDRYGRTSTVIASQVATKNWHEQLADPTIADAICDRLVHNAHVVVLTGGSMRKKKGMDTKKVD